MVNKHDPTQTGKHDYYAKEIPAEKEPEEYNHVERRAEILRIIIDRGNPYNVHQARLADRYGVSAATITKDMKRLRAYMDDAIGTEAKLTTRSVFENAVKQLQDEGEHAQAFDLVMRWNKWLQSIGQQEQAPSKHEVDADVTTREAGTETETWELVEDTDDSIEGNGVPEELDAAPASNDADEGE